MPHAIIHYSIGLLLGALTISSSATPATASRAIDCPTELPAQAIQLSPPLKGWHFFAESPLYLHSAAPIDGPAEQRGHLMEDKVRKERGREIYIYTLDGSFPDGKWLQCASGVHDEITLSKRIDDNTAACTITYRKGEKAGQNNIQIDCK